MAAEQAVPNDDNFAAAFDTLQTLGDKPIPADFETKANEPIVPEVTTPEKVVETPATTTEIETLTPEELAAKGETEVVAKTPEETAAEAAEAARVAEEARVLATQQAEDERLAKIIKAVKGDPKPEPQVNQPDPSPLYSQDDIAALQAVEKDWPDVAKAMTIQSRALAANITAHIFAEIGKVIAPKFQMYDELLDRTHVQALNQIDGYQTDRDKVIKWASEQPAYLQPAYQRVIEQGTVDEVADLINRYRKDTGAAPAPVTPAKPANELSPAAKKAAAALAPVPAKRSSAVTQTSPDDFDGAFAEAAKALEVKT